MHMIEIGANTTTIANMNGYKSFRACTLVEYLGDDDMVEKNMFIKCLTGFSTVLMFAACAKEKI